MAIYTKANPIDFVCGLGDNFYPYGVEDVDDPLFETHWADVFLNNDNKTGKPDRSGLRVPWHMALGNHDYMADHPHTEVEFTSSQRNHEQYGGLWHMPAPCYHFHSQLIRGQAIDTMPPITQTPTVDFFVLDTSGCQDHVMYQWPEQIEQLQRNIAALRVKLMASTARWKFVLGHHVLYTQGFEHSHCAELLRESNSHNNKKKLTASSFSRKHGDKKGTTKYPGFGLEQVLIDGGVHAYFGGHEHVFQHHYRNGVYHFCCGASGADIRPGTGLHHGVANHIERLDWVGTANDYGFVSVEVTWNRCEVSFHKAMKLMSWHDNNGSKKDDKQRSCGVGIIRTVTISHPELFSLGNENTDRY